ncbi:hypothetical protein [Limnoglobus roseus]|uniref:hypothetical protein n=1 Tax=Limnoglobus roseus TaxID=2598579 RepID=UPI0011EB7D7C|nr:hypothetical protein [Limnoglobus roseus]
MSTRPTLLVTVFARGSLPFYRGNFPAALCAVLAVATTAGAAWSWAENRTAARQLAAMAESDHLDGLLADAATFWAANAFLAFAGESLASKSGPVVSNVLRRGFRAGGQHILAR